MFGFKKKMSYKEQAELIKAQAAMLDEHEADILRYRLALASIVEVDAIHGVYRRWARAALESDRTLMLT